MSALDRYLETREANIMAYWLGEDGYHLVADHPSIHFIFDRDAMVFAWWWAYAEGPHAHKILRVEEQGDEVSLFHQAGKIVITPPWDTEGVIEHWRREADHDRIMRDLREMVKGLGEAPSQPRPRQHDIYRVMLELRPVPGSDPLEWAIVGAWAASEDEIVYWPMPEYEPFGQYHRDNIRDALDHGRRPLEIFEFWLERANGMTVMRSEQRTVKAPSAEAAARMAVERVLREGPES